MKEGFRNIYVISNNTTFREVLARFIPVVQASEEEPGKEKEGNTEMQSPQDQNESLSSE